MKKKVEHKQVKDKVCKRCGEYKFLYLNPNYRLLSGAIKKQYYCRNCVKKRQQVYSKQWRRKNREYLNKARIAYYYKYIKALQQRPLALKRYKTRQVFAYHIKSNKIQRQPCCVCGEKKTQGHHEDYNRPLCVYWLCQTHHTARHNNKLSLESYKEYDYGEVLERRTKNKKSKSKSSQKDLLQVYTGDSNKFTESKTCVIIIKDNEFFKRKRGHNEHK